MTKKLKHNSITALIYSFFSCLLLLIAFEVIVAIPVGILIGFFFGLLNDIITQLRKLNGEKFENLEEKNN